MKNVVLITIDGKTVEIQFHDSLVRDWFAGQALAGDWAAQSEEIGQFIGGTLDGCLRERGNLYYRMADAMLAEREKEVTHE